MNPWWLVFSLLASAWAMSMFARRQGAAPWWASVCSGCMWLLVCAAADQAPAAEQLLANPGFEAWADKLPQGWLSDSDLSKAEAARSGAHAVKLGPGMRVYQCLALEPGYLYDGSVWARGRGTLCLSCYEYRDGVSQGYVSSAVGEPVLLTDEWQQFRFTYSQGPAEAHLKGIAFAIASGRDGSEAVIDDAAVDKVAFPGKPPNLLANPRFSDVDGDGLPEQWQAEKRRLQIEPGPGGLATVRVSAALFSEDYQPAADHKDWWDWPCQGEQHGSGWPALPRPLGGAYTVMLGSAPVPIEPGRRYDVRMLLRELEIYGEFVAVRWFDPARRPLAEFEERIAYHHMHGHTGDWVSYVGRVTAPATARFAAVVVGCKQSSGTFWVAEPSLSIGLGAPNRNEPRYERTAAAVRQGLPQPAAPVRVRVRVLHAQDDRKLRSCVAAWLDL